MGIERVFITIIVATVVIYRQHQIVGTVVLERRGEGEGIPSLRAVEVTGIDQSKTCCRNVVGCGGETALRGVSEINVHVILHR